MAPSVATAPVASKATKVRRASGRPWPASDANREPDPPTAVRPPGNRIVPVAFLSGSGAKCSDIERRRKSIRAAGFVRNRYPDSEDQVKGKGCWRAFGTGSRCRADELGCSARDGSREEHSQSSGDARVVDDQRRVGPD